MRKVALLAIISVIFLANIFALRPDVSGAEVRAGTVLYVSPSSVEVSTATEFVVSIIVEDVADLMGFVIYLGFNSSILDVLSVVRKNPWGGLTGGHEINDLASYVHVYSSLLGPPYVSGKSTLFTVTFNATSRGHSALDLYSTILVNSWAIPIPHTSLNGFVTVYNVVTVPDDHLTIQEAINAASDGDTVFVRNGTYYENVVVNKTISLIGEDKEATTIDGGEIGTVVNILANEVAVQDFTIKNCKRTGGIGSEEERSCIVVKGNNTLIENNEIAHDNISMSWYIGIYLFQSSNNIIDRNYMKDDWNAIGILLVQSSNNTISNNNITDNGDGIWIEDYSSNNTVYGNTITDSWFSGIIVQHYSHNNNFYENTITGTNYEGIFLSRSNYNTFSGNFIANNGLGVELATGAPFNKFYHNNFINNTQWVHDPQNLVTFWDNGCEGNYWSNYNGTDLNEDGIGDEYLPWESVDNYPLMNPYWNPADINHDLEVDIYDVVLACAAYSSTPLDPNWNCHCDIAEPYGIINIFDIVMICSSYGEEYTP